MESMQRCGGRRGTYTHCHTTGSRAVPGLRKQPRPGLQGCWMRRPMSRTCGTSWGCVTTMLSACLALACRQPNWLGECAESGGVGPAAGACRHMQELTRYEAALWRHPETDEGVVRAAQHRTTAAELGILPSDSLADLASMPTRIAFLNQLADRVRLLQHVLTMWSLPASTSWSTRCICGSMCLGVYEIDLHSARLSCITHGAALPTSHWGRQIMRCSFA